MEVTLIVTGAVAVCTALEFMGRAVLGKSMEEEVQAIQPNRSRRVLRTDAELNEALRRAIASEEVTLRLPRDRIERYATMQAGCATAVPPRRAVLPKRAVPSWATQRAS